MAACDARWPVWQEFNARWSGVLDKHDAPYLHMREFTGSRGPYQGWDESQRRALMADCCDTLDGLAIDMMGAVLRSDDFYALSPLERLGVDDPYLVVFQDCLYGSALAGYMELPTEHVDVVYSQQDEFSSRFRQLFQMWKQVGEDGSHLGKLAFRQMRECPGLQLADLVAYELVHYYYLRDKHPHLRIRYPLKRIFEHQKSMNSGGFKYIPGWKLRLRFTGAWTAVQDVIWTDIDTWMPLLKQLAPEEIMPEQRIRRIALVRNSGGLESYRSRQIRRER